MSNPFDFGNIASGKAFVGREQELQTLASRLLSGGKILLTSPRRYGKTSLAFHLKSKLERKHHALVIYVDILSCANLQQFITKYARALSHVAESRTERLVSFVQKLLPSLRPQLEISPEGEVSFQLAFQPQTPEEIAALEKVLDLAEILAVRKKKRLVVVFDEFQALQDWDTDPARQTLLWKFRSKLQNHPHVGYLFAGSQKHALEQMAIPKNSPFFRMLEIVPLEKLDAGRFALFIARRFREARQPIRAEVAQAIVERASNIPYYVLNLSHELFEVAREQRVALSVKQVDEAVSRLAQRNNPLYEKEWETIGLIQRNLLRAVALGHQKLLSAAVMKRFTLRSVGGVQKALKGLKDRQTLVQEGSFYVFDDVWFCEWIRNREKA